MQISMAGRFGLLLLTLAHARQLRQGTAPDMANEVAKDAMENLQIHDGFAQEEKDDEEKERQVKANKDLSALQTHTGPDMASKVATESMQNLQIHDGFAQEQQEDEEKLRQVKADKDLSALQTHTAPDMANEVAKESMENLQIHDGFAFQEKVDEEKERQVRADKDLSALQFGNWKVALDKDLKTKMLVKAKASAKHGIVNPCDGIECGTLSCPAGFSVETVPGHCCGYCVNPNIKLESVITGAVGSHGGKPSGFCDDVWCFPSMCTKEETAATLDNGMCCNECPE